MSQEHFTVTLLYSRVLHFHQRGRQFPNLRVRLHREKQRKPPSCVAENKPASPCRTADPSTLHLLDVTSIATQFIILIIISDCSGSHSLQTLHIQYILYTCKNTFQPSHCEQDKNLRPSIQGDPDTRARVPDGKHLHGTHKNVGGGIT